MIKVYIVDDSATVRQLLTSILNESGGIEVIGTSSNPVLAWPKLHAHWPDVIISDIEMPEMDGITFLKKIMCERPTPVIMCSLHIETNLNSVMNVLSLGAVDVISKPKVGIGSFIEQSQKKIVEAVRKAAMPQTKLKRAERSIGIERFDDLEASKNKKIPDTPSVIAIGCSTGGTQALETILPVLPEPTPPIVIVQHMPTAFIPALANRLDNLSNIRVKVAEQGEVLKQSTAYIGPGEQHLTISRVGSLYQVELKPGPAINRHIPSVDVLFKSMANEAGHNVTCFLLTGMGKDGARGMLDLKISGATTYAQNKETSTVFGMPGAAVKLGAASYQVALNSIPAVITNLAVGDSAF